jgi:hypothetical protein
MRPAVSTGATVVLVGELIVAFDDSPGLDPEKVRQFESQLSVSQLVVRNLVEMVVGQGKAGGASATAMAIESQAREVQSELDTLRKFLLEKSDAIEHVGNMSYARRAHDSLVQLERLEHPKVTAMLAKLNDKTSDDDVKKLIDELSKIDPAIAADLVSQDQLIMLTKKMLNTGNDKNVTDGDISRIKKVMNVAVAKSGGSVDLAYAMQDALGTDYTKILCSRIHNPTGLPVGMRVQHRTVGIEPEPNVGVIKVDLFIADSMSGLPMPALDAFKTEPTGNGRSFNAGATIDQSKVQISIDFDKGTATAAVNETTWKTWSILREYSDSYQARPLKVVYTDSNGKTTTSGPKDAGNRVYITTTRGPDGLPTVKVRYIAELAGVPTLLPDALVPAINGTVTIAVKPTMLSISRDRDAYPSMGVYRTKDGRDKIVFNDGETEAPLDDVTPVNLGLLSGLSGAYADSGTVEIPR